MGNQFSIADFLPQPPWLGPPLPRCLGLTWPWLQGGEQGLALPSLPSLPFLSSMETSYENLEEWSWVDWKGRERKITVTRKARTR